MYDWGIAKSILGQFVNDSSAISLSRIVRWKKIKKIMVLIKRSNLFRDVDEGGMREAVRDVHDFFLLDVVKKVSLDHF